MVLSRRVGDFVLVECKRSWTGQANSSRVASLPLLVAGDQIPYAAYLVLTTRVGGTRSAVEPKSLRVREAGAKTACPRLVGGPILDAHQR